MRFKEAYLWIGVSLAILCIWVWLFCLPLASRINDKKRELADVEARIANIETELSHPKEAKKGEDSAAILAGPLDQIPHLEGFPYFLRRIALSARNGGVTIDRLNGRAHDGNVGAASVFAYPVAELDFTGRFIDIGRVLEQIQAVKAYRRIIRAQLISLEDAYPDLKCSVEIEFEAWRD
jgi:hypothetical protein